MATAALPVRKLFSADSHVVEPGMCYIDNIELKYRDRAPHFVKGERGGEFFVIDGRRFPNPAAQFASSGRDLAKADFEAMRLDEMNTGAYDPAQRLLDQDRDGVVGEIIYPSIGMIVCGTQDIDYKQACMWAYNRWMHQFMSHAPDRLIGLAMTAVRSVEEAIKDLHKMKEMGFRGVMLPSEPGTTEDYHDRSFDPLWETAVELNMPISFHILTSKATVKVADGITAGKKSDVRGPKQNNIQEICRANQDVIGMFIWGGVFERHPDLKLVCVEADASWAPHFVMKMDHYYVDRPDTKLHVGLEKQPSYYFQKNIFLTFQDDWVVFDLLKYFAPGQLLWANDYPHPDGCWPRSQQLLTTHAAYVSESQLAGICHNNVVNLYGLNAA
jgi:predicted TIM-barrel fold metal-dependent hydrolase